MLSITPIGAILIPVSLLIFAVRPAYLMPWTILMATFQAAAVVNIGGAFPIGVAPYYFSIVLIAIRFVPMCIAGRVSFTSNERYLSRPLLILTLWGVVSAFTLPALFAGVNVDAPRAGMDAAMTVPLQWTFSNAAQAGYLTLHCIFLLYVIWMCTDHAQMLNAISAFRWSGAIAAVLGAYQLTSHLTGLPYPLEFLNSNLVWAQLTDQTLAGTWRISATFTEPSVAGAFFAVWSTFLLFLTTDSRTSRPLDWLFLCFGMAMVVLTTSTTGYIVTGAAIVLFVWKVITRLLTKRTIDPKIVLVAVMVSAAIFAAICFIPNFRGVLTEVLWEKNLSVSGQDRGNTIWQAFEITIESLGLGVGLGSNRPSGMLFYIMSNLGIPGLAIFCSLVYVTCRFALKSGVSVRSDSPVGGYLNAAMWAFAIELLAMVVSGADISAPQLWVVWALVVATGSHAWVVARAADESVDDELGAVVSRRRDRATMVVLTPDLRAD